MMWFQSIAALSDIYSLSAFDAAGNKVDFGQFRGKVLIIVNTASECGLRGQLESLEKLHREFHGKGLEILAFPCNDFAGQEPLSAADAERFCKQNYQAGFTLMEKVHVRGAKTHPVYTYLCTKSLNGITDMAPVWNYHKFLVGRDGRLVDFFLPTTSPESSRFRNAISKELAKGF